MSEKLTLKVPAHLAQYVRPDAAVDMKMKVINGDLPSTPVERGVLLFFLCYDKETNLRSLALAAMRRLEPETVLEILGDPQIHPKFSELLLRLFPEASRSYESPELTAAEEAVADTDNDAEDSGEEYLDESDSDLVEEHIPEEEPLPEDDEFHSKYQLAQTMGIGEKIKTALTGDKEWRSLLLKDSNKLVSSAVVKNPRITDPEILTICKSQVQNDEIVRLICHNKEWVKNYEIKKALVMNTKTPLPMALRFMGFLTDKDIASLAKSKNISSVISNQAKRLLSNKKK